MPAIHKTFYATLFFYWRQLRCT